jgi:2-C-methyl-D-erythritol 2,4-cyclodiphosphate synthase
MNHPRPKRVRIEGLAPASRKQSPVPENVPTSPFLIGHGYDLHRLQTGGKLTLAGIVVSEEISPIAHSDGDVVLHALVDALLGAAGLGDIGQLFPNTDPKWKDAPSKLFVDEAYRRVTKLGYTLGNLDITLLCEKPKLAPFKSQMVENLRNLLNRSATYNVKAGTNEGCDSIGRGEAIAAHAVVLLIRKG